jgi:hypothetical protein
MQIERWTGPPVETHTYLVADEADNHPWPRAVFCGGML